MFEVTAKTRLVGKENTNATPLIKVGKRKHFGS